jgi:proteasome lid subunit RPN8/RPN11
MPQQFESKHLSVRVVIDDAVYDTLTEAAISAGRRETGGVLIGRYEGRTVARVDLATTAPPDSKRGYDWFERGESGLKETLQEHWDGPVRRHFVGEWHFHPAPDGTPSPRDVDQMFEVSAENRYECSQPILLIVSRTESALLFRVFLIFDEAMHELSVAPHGS